LPGLQQKSIRRNEYSQATRFCRVRQRIAEKLLQDIGDGSDLGEDFRMASSSFAPDVADTPVSDRRATR
jgi:hypothetical protein